jgi:hypothetical protein
MLLFMDGMAHYPTALLPAKYTVVNSVIAGWSIVPEGRFGNCIKRVTNGVNDQGGFLGIAPLTTRLGAWSPTASGVIGFAIKTDDLSHLVPPGSFYFNDNAFCNIKEGAQYHLSLWVENNGTFSLWRYNSDGSSATLLARSAEGLSTDTWLFVEFKWVLHDTAGTAEVRVNGTPILTFTGSTRAPFSGIFFPNLGVWNGLSILGETTTGGAPVMTTRVSDLYLADLNFSAAQDVHDFLGDGTIQTIRPNGAGASTGWTPFPAAPNWDQTNDVVPDADTTYVKATTPALKDTYQFEDLPANSIVKGAHICILARKETEGAAAVAPVVRQGSTDYQLPTQGVTSLVYDRYITQACDINPATLARFTAAEVNGGQFGAVKVT